MSEADNMSESEDTMATMTPAQRKLFELRMKVNAGRKANKKEVAAEHERVKNGDKKAKKEQNFKQRQEKKAIAATGTAHLLDTAETAASKAKRDEKKAKRKAAFGWDVFNQDSLYKGYKKRMVNLPTAGQASTEHGTELATTSLEDELSYGKNDKVHAAGLNRMAKELEDRIAARKTFSRRRQHIEGEDVDFINGQNRLFNNKAKKAYDKYTVEIRQNLERGTAL